MFASKWFVFFCIALSLLTACKSAPQPEPEIAFQEPQFTVTSIAVLQDDLIVTRFRLKLTVDNPNPFPLAIVSFHYDLYGDGRFWTGGKETDFPAIPAQDSQEISLDFEMNFINMRRNLLDDIIAMRRVQYRFIGNVEMGKPAAQAAPFQIRFELSGVSDVKK